MMKSRRVLHNPNTAHDISRPGKETKPSKDSSSDTKELRVHFEALQAKHKVLQTTRLPSGQIVDWIEAKEQLPSGKVVEPPPHEEIQFETRGRRKESPVEFELAHADDSLGPPGTVPILRKDLRALPKGISLQDYLSKYGHAVRTRFGLEGDSIEAPGDPDHDYGNTGQKIKCFGGEGFLSAYSPYVQWSDEFSLEQISMPALFPKKGPPQETVEGGWQVCQQLYNDWKAHLFVFYTTNGYSKKGDNIGGYNRDVLGWVQHSRTTFPGALIQPNSVTGGSQRVLFIKYRLWQGNWWFRVGNEWIGFYPASLFSEAGLRDKADAIFFYGEVADSTAHLGKSRTDMGSGRWANERWPFAGYAHNLRVQDQASGHLVDYDTTTGWENESDPSLYTLETHIKSGTSWGSYFWFGGPGAIPSGDCPKLLDAIAEAQAEIRTLQEDLKTAGPTLKPGIAAQIRKWRAILTAAQNAARLNACI
jgi:hypothetical protein